MIKTHHLPFPYRNFNPCTLPSTPNTLRTLRHIHQPLRINGLLTITTRAKPRIFYLCKRKFQLIPFRDLVAEGGFHHTLIIDSIHSTDPAKGVLWLDRLSALLCFLDILFILDDEFFDLGFELCFGLWSHNNRCFSKCKEL